MLLVISSGGYGSYGHAGSKGGRMRKHGNGREHGKDTSRTGDCDHNLERDQSDSCSKISQNKLSWVAAA